MKIKLITIAALSGLIALNGCSDSSKRSSTAAGVASLVGSLASGNSKLASYNRSIQRIAMAQKNRDRVEQFMKTVKPTGALCDAYESEFEPEASCAVTSCSDADPNDVSITITCSEMDTTTTCGADTYTLTGFDYSTTISVTPTTISWSMSMDGTVNGGAFSNTSLTCSMGLSIDQTAMNASTDIDCADTNFSCTVGSETLTCADIESASATTTCQ